jgi:cytochrome c peroxidase
MQSQWFLIAAIALSAACASILAGYSWASDRPQTSPQTEMTVGDEDASLVEQAQLLFGLLPDAMPGAETDTPQMVSLGEALYFSNELSVTRTQSCNTCHPIDGGRAGADNLPTSPGAHGEMGTRNSPTTLNAGYQIAQFWDGRAHDLEEQAKGPILNPLEMGMPDPDTVVERLEAHPELSQAFAEAFPDDDLSITYDNLAKAIGAFERTLKSESRLDDFMRGDAAALTQPEKKGLELFISTGCIQCHNGPLIGATTFQKLGKINPYETDDLGRFEVTGDEDSKYVFKVPQLRNVSLTAPYFHAGQVETLEEAVETMAWIQLNVKLEPAQTAKLVAFLHALADPERQPALTTDGPDPSNVALK